MTVRHARASTLAVLVACMASLIPAPAPLSTASASASAEAAGATPVPAARRAKQRINAFRARHGVRALRSSRSLDRSARAYARRMLWRGYFGHLSRISASGRFRMLGEVLLLQPGGRARASVAVRGWAGSPGHRAVLLSPSFRQMGVGTATGQFGGGRSVTMWVAQVARR